MKPDLCIYHANCMGGFTAAWAVHQRWPEGVEFEPATYGQQPPDVAGKHVLIVDFSYPAMVLVNMVVQRGALSVTVLDHHKTAEAELSGFAEAQFFADAEIDYVPTGIRSHFDMSKSGARLAFEYCFGPAKTPPLVSYVEDRDLWKWQLPESRAINAAAGAFSQDFEQWDRLNEAVRVSIGRMDESILVFEGKAILLQREKDIDAVIDTSWRWMTIGGHRVPVANAPFFLASETANRLAEGNPFAATYFDGSSGERIFSLRSLAEGADVSTVAKAYGGGGHRHAAGFKMPRGWEGDQL